MELSFKPKRRDDVRSEDVQHETVLYDPTRGQAVYLNETAAVIWKLCDGSRTVSEIAELLTREMGDGTGQVATDVEEIVGRFQDARLVA